MKKIMYSLKKYNHNGDFISEIPPYFIKNIWNFTETINSWQGELTIELSDKISENFLNFWDLIKIFFDWRLIYSWFLLSKNIFIWDKNTFEISLIWFLDNLRNYLTQDLKTYKYYTYKQNWRIETDYNLKIWNILNIYEEMINILRENESEIFNFDKNEIKNVVSEYHNVYSWTFVDLLNGFSEYYDMNYFLWANWKIRTSWSPNIKNYNLVFWKDIFDISIKSDYLDLINYVKMGWIWENDWGILKVKDEDSIKKYWMKYLEIEDKYFYKKQSALDFMKRKLVLNPFENIKFKIYDKKFFWVLKILDLVTITNFKNKIENKKIVKITYNINYMEVELENFKTLWKEILWV